MNEKVVEVLEQTADVIAQNSEMERQDVHRMMIRKYYERRGYPPEKVVDRAGRKVEAKTRLDRDFVRETYEEEKRLVAPDGFEGEQDEDEVEEDEAEAEAEEDDSESGSDIFGTNTASSDEEPSTNVGTGGSSSAFLRDGSSGSSATTTDGPPNSDESDSDE